ncbi:MAG: hypothetical protein GY777_16925 [Candidatus Brocadiaceae bacterium]|nr:hypothetical protein [Candidatus Brocadiaceae bacterium]
MQTPALKSLKQLRNGYKSSNGVKVEEKPTTSSAKEGWGQTLNIEYKELIIIIAPTRQCLKLREKKK